MKSECPDCQYAFGRPERAAFSSLIRGARKSTPCPQCGAGLTWARRPWKWMWGGYLLFSLGGIALLATIVWSLFEGRIATVEEDVFKGHPFGWGMMAFVLIGGACVARGFASLRLVRILPTLLICLCVLGCQSMETTDPGRTMAVEEPIEEPVEEHVVRVLNAPT